MGYLVLLAFFVGFGIGASSFRAQLWTKDERLFAWSYCCASGLVVAAFIYIVGRISG